MNPSWHQNVVILTGMIGSGKSTAARILAELGAHVESADELSRWVVRPDSPGLKQVVEAFGESILQADGELDRKLLGDWVFRDASKRKLLESITHPRIREETAKRFGEVLKKSPRAPLLVYDCPLYFESGLDQNPFRAVILVLAPKELCLERASERDGLSAEEARRRYEAQMPPEEKRKRSDFVVKNDGTLQQLRRDLKSVFEQIATN